VTSGKSGKNGFQKKQAIDMGCSERQQGKKAKPAHKQSLWKIKAAALVKRLDKIPKNLNRPVMDCKLIYRHE